MAQGVEVDIRGGIAELAFADHQARGEALAKLHEIGGPDCVAVDTSGTRRTYVVPESIASEAGLVDKPKRAVAGRGKAARA
jgi:hypothetical protein